MTEVEIKTRSYTHYHEMAEWCEKQFGNSSGFIDDTWVAREAVAFGYCMFYFSDEKHGVWFKLRWL